MSASRWRDIAPFVYAARFACNPTVLQNILINSEHVEKQP